MEVLTWVGFSQSLFSVLIFMFIKKDDSLANRLLAVWLFIIGFEYLTTGIDIHFGKIHLTNPFLIFNPLLYFYSKSLINPGLKLKWWQLWHVLPWLLVKIGAYVFDVELNQVDFFRIDSSTWFKMAMASASIISFFGYTIPSLINVHKHRINLINEFSTIDRKITLGWLLFVIIFYMIFIIVAYLLGIINILTQISTHAQLVSFAFILAMVYAFSFYGLLQGQIYPVAETVNSDSYKNPRLSLAEKNEIKTGVEEYFKSQKPYLDCNLTIVNVSDKMNISRHALTEVLNTAIGMNFYRFVNTYRVDEVKQKLADTEYSLYSIDAIGFECGFNSKSTFYAVFKKTTGMTPSQYRSSLKK